MKRRYPRKLKKSYKKNGIWELLQLPIQALLLELAKRIGDNAGQGVEWQTQQMITCSTGQVDNPWFEYWQNRGKI